MTGDSRAAKKSEYRDKYWKTMGSRFNASRRLISKSNWSVAGIALLSVYCISLSILPRFITTLNRDITDFFTIVFSIFILVFSLIENSQKYIVRAERLENCAKRINTILSEVNLYSDIDTEQLSEKLVDIEKRYQQELNACPENHEEVDLQKFKSQYRNYLNINWIEATYYNIHFYLSSSWLYIIAIFIAPIIVVTLLL
ncbi:MAG: SLATT domain-containing protein [candidate division FCPU426 bacterium]